jgi:hypothetical protein
MSKPTRLDEMNARLNPIGFHVDSYSPGDGRRYKFLPYYITDDQKPDYFSRTGVKTVLGWKNAELFAEGILCGAEAAKERH